MTNASPNFAEFKRLAQRGNVVPVYRTIVADLLSPVSAFLSLSPQHGRESNSHPHSFLLESVEGGERVGRYTFFGMDPFQIVSCRGDRITVRRGAHREEETGNLFEFLRRLGARYKSVEIPGLPPFTAGAVGYVSYEAVRMLEHLPPRVPPDVDLDDAVFMYFSNVLAFDHVQHRLFLISNVLTEEGKGSLRAKYDAACRHLDLLESRLRRPLKLPRVRRPEGALRVRPNMPRAKYEAMVERSKEYIRAGDIFQVVLSQRVEVPVRVPAFDVYRALRAVNPSPYMYYLRMGESTVLGSSPEMLVKVAGRDVEYRPIAGTRPRGKSEEEDKRMEEELRSDSKECAEHIMLVDLGRNDVGRVSEFSSVKPRDIMFVERYSHVMHLVSQITGKLRPDADSYAALAACFPAGTLTGAPKVRAMEIIDELEPTRRGLYGGSVLYLDFSGNLNSCIVIRTVFIKNKTAYLQAGAGIVADSVPAREYEECQNKARAVLRAFELAEKGL
ncbi:MAG: anthranilate synthase component I [Acidobacteriota bacterium]|nr:anthranilate synthase component I [Acidobacteriota bacterium]